MKYFTKLATNAPTMPNTGSAVVDSKEMSNRVNQAEVAANNTSTPNVGGAQTQKPMNDHTNMPAKVAFWNGFLDEFYKEAAIMEKNAAVVGPIIAGAARILPWIGRGLARLIPGIARTGSRVAGGVGKNAPKLLGTGGTAAAGGSKFWNFMNSWKGGLATSLPFMFMGGGGKAAKAGQTMTAGGNVAGNAIRRPFATTVADTTPYASVASNRNPYAQNTLM